MPKRRYRWSHPTHSLYVLAGARVPVRVVVEIKRPTTPRPHVRTVYQWRLKVSGVDLGVFATFRQAEDAVPVEAARAVA